MLILEQSAIQLVRKFEEYYFVQRDVNAVVGILDDRINWIGIGKTRARGKKQIRRLLHRECEAYPARFLICGVSYQADMISETICMVQGELSLREIDAPKTWPDVVLFLSAVVREGAAGLSFSQIHLSARLQEERETLIPRFQTYASIEPLRRLLLEKNDELEEKTSRLNMLTNSVPGGVIQCRYSSQLELLQYSQGFLTMLGYTAEELEKLFQNQLTQLIYPEDLGPTWEEVHRQLEHGNVKQIEYRCVCKNGDLIWILDRGQLVTLKDGSQIFNCILLDATEIHAAQEALRLSLERHKIIMDQTENAIFEWDMVKDIVSCSPHWEKKFGLSLEMSGREFQCMEHIHPDDVYQFQGLIRKITTGIPYCEAEFRAEVKEGNYVWFCIRVSLQMDRNQRPIKAVGVVIDIDREKRETQLLQDRAERDSLTGLYNKGTAKVFIEEYLDFYDCRCALIVIDVDNFKQVNDKLGHLSGDKLLSRIAEILQKQFRSMDMIGRIGGDEFIVLMRHLEDKVIVARKCRQLLNEICDLKQEIPCDISGSIGVAMCPQDGRDYTTLFRNADLALYSAKLHGKNNYSFYASMERVPIESAGQYSTFCDDMQEGTIERRKSK